MFYLFAADSATGELGGLLEFVKAAGTPGMLLGLYVVWWRTVGKEKAEKDNQTALALQRASITLGEVASNLYRLHDKTEAIHDTIADDADRLVTRGERIVERLDERFPSGAINPGKTVGA